jgi:hypothetical protein
MNPYSSLRGVFELDLRSLALFRIALGAVLLADFWTRLGDTRAHYTEDGVLPMAALAQMYPELSSALGWLPASEVAVLTWIALGAIAAMALAAGYRTRLATAGCWLLVAGLQQRNPFVTNAGDGLLRLLLFFAMFLPLGAYFSVDRLRSGQPATALRVRSLAGAALMIQIALVYWCTALLKSDPAWRVDGTAVYLALQIDQLAKPLSVYLLTYPSLLRPISLAVYWWEAFGPFLVFVPFFRGSIRLAAVAAFIALHAGFFLFLEIGLFVPISIAGWLALLPSRFWERSSRRVESELMRGSLAGSLAAGYALALVVGWNVTTIVKPVDPPAPFQAGLTFAATLGLDQEWGMFAPLPLDLDGWYVAAGRLANGREVDLLAGGRPLTFAKPRLVSAQYPNDRWRKYLMNLEMDEFAKLRGPYARWLCADWNSSHSGERHLVRLRVIFMAERTWSAERIDAPQPVLLHEMECEAELALGGAGR